jgi:O-antigen/teichoic acid export membrane protein
VNDGPDQIKRGMLWLGSASAVARVLDLGGTFVVLGLLTQEEMGLAALALSACAVLESLSGLGIGPAHVQSKHLSANEKSSLFWLTSGLGVVLGAVLVGCAPLLAKGYGEPALTPLAATLSLKLVLVGIGVVPLHLLSKRLAFKEVGAVQTIAALGEGASKIGLALAGTGAWALVGGNVARGLLLVVALSLLSRFRPRLHFALTETKRFVRFGLQVASSSILHQVYKNADYFLVGKLLGIEALGLYRVAFDVAMQPTDAIIAVVNRVSFAVYSRLKSDPAALLESFLRSTRSFMLMGIPAAAFIVVTAGDVLQLLGGGRWAAAVPGLRILAAASLLRAAVMIFPQVYVAVGKPKLAVFDSAASLALLTGAFWIALTQFAELGVLAVCLAWLLVYPMFLAAHIAILGLLLGLRPLSYARALWPGLGGGAIMLGSMMLARQQLSTEHLGVAGLTVVATAGLLVYASYLRWVLGVRLRELIGQRSAIEPSTDSLPSRP